MSATIIRGDALTQTRWRTGRKAGRTLYAQPGAEPTDQDPLIGVMDTPELAAEACRAHNEDLTRRQAIA